MDIQAKYNNKEVYAVRRLFAKKDVSDFVADGGLIRYKRLSSDLERTGKEFKLDVKVSTFLSFFVIFVFISMFLIYFSGSEIIEITDIVRGFVVFIVPCIASVIALIKYTDYKEQLLTKATAEMETFKEKYHVARRFNYDELEKYSVLSKKVTGIKGDLTFYQISDCLLPEDRKEVNIVAILNNKTNSWHVLEYLLVDTHLEMYKIYEVEDNSSIIVDWH